MRLIASTAAAILRRIVPEDDWGQSLALPEDVRQPYFSPGAHAVEYAQAIKGYSLLIPLRFQQEKEVMIRVSEYVN
jgi:hypothetical protein